MPAKICARSRILVAVHETASDLHRLGFISKRKLDRFDALCLAPVPAYSPAKIRKLRSRLKISRTALASVLNTSVSTVRKWEQGEKQPGGSALKLLNLLDRKGIEAVL